MSGFSHLPHTEKVLNWGTNPLARVVCRPALQKDTPDVLAMARLIWNGQDYIPYIWDEWLADSQAVNLVLEWDGRVVGLLRLVRQSLDQWWLEGLRVHPEYRGRRLASIMFDAALEISKKQGGGTVRLLTGAMRKAVHHLSESRGFVKTGEYLYHTAPVLPERAPWALLDESCLDEALQRMMACEHFPPPLRLMDLGWIHAEPRPEILRPLLQAGRGYSWQNGRGLVFTIEDETEENVPYLSVSFAACQPEDFPALLLDFRRLAGQLEKQMAAWQAPDLAWLTRDLVQAGFGMPDEEDRLYLYAKME